MGVQTCALPLSGWGGWTTKTPSSPTCPSRAGPPGGVRWCGMGLRSATRLTGMASPGGWRCRRPWRMCRWRPCGPRSTPEAAEGQAVRDHGRTARRTLCRLNGRFPPSAAPCLPPDSRNRNGLTANQSSESKHSGVIRSDGIPLRRRRCALFRVLAAIDEARIPEPGADGEDAPPFHVLHERRLAQALNHCVIVEQNGVVVLVDRVDRLAA